MNRRKAKKSNLNRHIANDKYVRENGEYLDPMLRWMLFPRSKRWRHAMREMGHACSSRGDFACMCCGIPATTWRRWCLAVKDAS